MKNRSVMEHSFSRVPKAEIPRSSFDRSHGFKTTFDGGWLIPIFVDEYQPGDTFNLKMTAFARLATPIFPLMDNMIMDTFFFAVPNRTVWDNWEKFCGAQEDPGDSIDFLVPTTAAHTAATGDVADYMGVPIGVSLLVNTLPFRCYNKIWNDWFRDQNLQDSVNVPTHDGTDDYNANYTLLKRGKRHDYFTSCLPFPQKGVSVALPLGTQAPVSGLGLNTAANFDLGPSTFKDSVSISESYPDYLTTTGDAFVMRGAGPGTGAIPDVYADLSAATAATINQLRQSFQIQKLLERDARGGTRMVEITKSHFGVTTPDFRLQRAEYLGGGSSPVGISAVAQTSESNTTPQGTLSAFGTVHASNHGFTKSFTEHGHIIGLVSVRADITYQQGLNRMWKRSTRYDYFWPALQGLGEQAVLNQEIYAQGTGADILVFGYNERYAEYRYSPSLITGLFRSDAAGLLDAWHLSQDFAALPVLDATFIADTPPIDRVIAVPSEPHFLFDAYFDLRCARPMPMYGVPGLIDHF